MNCVRVAMGLVSTVVVVVLTRATAVTTHDAVIPSMNRTVPVEFPPITLQWPSSTVVRPQESLRVGLQHYVPELDGRKVCLSLNEHPPTCHPVVPFPRQILPANLSPGRHSVYVCVTTSSDENATCRDAGVPIRRSGPDFSRRNDSAGPELEPHVAAVAGVVHHRTVFDVALGIVPAPGADECGMFTPDTANRWPSYFGMDPYFREWDPAPPFFTILSPAQGATALRSSPNSRVVFVVAPTSVRAGAVALADAPLICVLLDTDLRPVHNPPHVSTVSHFVCSEYVPSARFHRVTLEGTPLGFHVAVACRATKTGQCVAGTMSLPSQHFFTDDVLAVEDGAGDGRRRRWGTDWVTAALLFRVNRVGDPPLRLKVPAVLSQAQADALADEYLSARPRPRRDEVVLSADHWAVAIVTRAMEAALEQAGVGGVPLRLEYAVVSGSDRGNGILVHADNSRLTADGLTRVPMVHSVFRAWGVSVMLSRPDDFTGGSFEFLAAPPGVCGKPNQGDGVLFSAGYENVHFVAGGITGDRVVGLFWFHEEPWGTAPDAVASYRSLLNYFHLHAPGQKNRTAVEHHTQHLHDILKQRVAEVGAVATQRFHLAVGRHRVLMRRAQFAQLEKQQQHDVEVEVEAEAGVEVAGQLLLVGDGPNVTRERVVIVTGARTGIGRALVRQLSSVRHVRVVAVVRALTPDVVWEAEDLHAAGRSVDYVVSDLAQVAKVAGTLRGHLQGLSISVVDAIVHAAGVAPLGWTEDSFRQALAVNCHAPILLTHALHTNGLFRQDGNSVSLVVSSHFGAIKFSPAPYRDAITGSTSLAALLELAFLPATSPDPTTVAAYSVSKACVNRATQLQSVDPAQRFVSVSVHPGHVRTKLGGMNAPSSPEEGAVAVLRALVNADTLDGQFVQPDGRPFESW